jgi:hypothetical protein
MDPQFADTLKEWSKRGKLKEAVNLLVQKEPKMHPNLPEYYSELVNKEFVISSFGEANGKVFYSVRIPQNGSPYYEVFESDIDIIDDSDQ